MYYLYFVLIYLTLLEIKGATWNHEGLFGMSPQKNPCLFLVEAFRMLPFGTLSDNNQEPIYIPKVLSRTHPGSSTENPYGVKNP